MRTEELRERQAPLKQRYREEPEAARITLKAQGKLGEGVTCLVETGRALVEAGLHPLTGGDGIAICSGDMLLQALVACAGVTLDRETPVGFQTIRLAFDLDTDANDEQIATLLRLTERFCVVFQTLQRSPEAQVTVNRRATATPHVDRDA